MERKIINRESISSGKKQRSNDDDIYIGEDFAAVIDGVSHKSSLKVGDKEIKIAQIITEAIRKIDGEQAPQYAKTLNFDEFVRYINWYISEYLTQYDMTDEIGKVEATGVVYSKYQNQIWLVGDCRAIYDGHIVKNPLKVDEVYIDIRIQIVKALLEAGYSEEELETNDISKTIIWKPETLEQYIHDTKSRERIEQYRRDRIKKALLECGFSEKEIEEESLVKKYYNPRDLQAMLKNNPNAGDYGYAIFNGQYTEQKNCKVEQLPENVKKIKLFSDGFSINALNNDKDIGYAVRKNWAKTKKDPLSISENRATHPAVRYGKGAKEKAIDDASAVVIEIASKEEREDSERE